MKTATARVITPAIAAIIIAAVVVLATLMAQPAGAVETFSPTLSASAPYTEKIAVAETGANALTAPAPKLRATVAPAAASSSYRAVARSGGSEAMQAKAILAGLKRKYPILSGVTVSFGDARGYQAISYYQSGRIVVSPTHTASLERILNHEVWHIIDWRDNGRIDWGENVPR